MDSGNRAESLGGNRSDGRERKLLAEKFYHRVEVDHDDQGDQDDQGNQGDQGGKDDQDEQDGNRSEERERKLLAVKFYHRVEVDQDDQDGGVNFHWPEEKEQASKFLLSIKQLVKGSHQLKKHRHRRNVTSYHFFSLL